MTSLLCRAGGATRRARLGFGLCLMLLAAGIGLRADRAVAQEIMPYEFTVLPAGTNLALGYYAYGHDSGYSIARGPTLSDSGLETHVGLARFVHYDAVAGFPAGFQVYQGFGSLQDARIGGQPLASTAGAQNLALAAFLWPYVDESAKTAVIVVGTLNPPTGTYDPFAQLNLGDNRARVTLQAGLQQELSDQLGFNLAYDAQLYGDNDRAYPGAGLLSQGPTHRLQAWLNWRWSPAFNTSLGYTGLWGGEQRLDGVVNGTRTEVQRIRVQSGYFIDPTLQVAVELNHDLAATGGFRQELGAILRVLKVF